MRKKKVVLAGIGKLGTALMKHWNQNQVKIGIYHPETSKAEQFVQCFQNGYVVTENEFEDTDIFILALPVHAIIPFITHIMTKNISLTNTHIINMATALNTNELKNKFPSLTISGIKYMGHAKDLLLNGNGLFITESYVRKEIEELFRHIGKIKKDREEHLVQVNKLATYYGAKAAIEMEAAFAEKGLASEYVQRALTSIAPEVMRSYCEDSLGHFAQEIVEGIRLKKEEAAD